MGVQFASLTALAVGVLALGTGCQGLDVKKAEPKRPDVTQPGVLPSPQETTATGGSVVQASATAPVAPVGVPPAPAPSGVGALTSKLTGTFERKVPATDFAVGWQPRIAYLPDPVKNGRMSPGIAGQMFLFGGPKLEFAQADGVLTVDLVDDTPRPAGQPPATPERWQFDKNTLRNLQTRDETFGKSYVLFLPWPAYKSDITRVKISARYDPENGSPLFATPSTVTLDSTPFGTPVFNEVSKNRGGATSSNYAPEARPFGASNGPHMFPAAGAQPVGTQTGPPIPLSGSHAAPMIPIHNPAAPAPMMPIPGAAAPIPIPSGGAPMIPIQNGPFPIPGRSGGLGAPPAGAAPFTPSAPPLGAGAMPLGAGAMPVAPPAGVMPLVPATPAMGAGAMPVAPGNPSIGGTPLPADAPQFGITLPVPRRQ